MPFSSWCFSISVTSANKCGPRLVRQQDLVDNEVWRITREGTMPVVDPRLAGKPVPKISREAMERGHVARAVKARGAAIAFLDQRIPAYEREIINMVGMGVTENAELAPHVKAGAAGFSVTYVRAPQGCGAALHRHATEEVFIPV